MGNENEVKIFNITIPKIDYQIIEISLKIDGELVELGENDLMFFSVAKSPEPSEYIFQKTLDNGIIYDSASKKYLIEINSADTKDLTLNKTYGYDITIYYNENKPKQKIKGTFKVSDKYTMNGVV